jgi:hypothetical protein
MKLANLGPAIDERFLTHRLRSTSMAGIVGGAVSTLLWAYRFYVSHIWSWDLLAVSLTIVGVKMSMLLWYRVTD